MDKSRGFTPPSVKTSCGVFYQDSYWEHYKGYGSTRGELIPATPELIAEAEKQEQEEIEYRNQENVIRKAKKAAYQIGSGLLSLPYPMAVELIALVKKYKE